MKIGLRRAAPTEAAFLAEVYASTRTEELKATDWSDEQKAQFCKMQFEAQDAHYRKHYPTATFDVILCDDCPAGRLYVDRWAQEIRIMDIALLPNWRAKGVGTLLLQQLQAEATAAQKALSIHVETFNPALRLYERLGFKLKENKGVYLLLEWRPDQCSASHGSGEDHLKL